MAGEFYLEFSYSDPLKLARLRSLTEYLGQIKTEPQVTDLDEDTKVWEYFLQTEQEYFRESADWDLQNVLYCIGNGDYYIKELQELGDSRIRFCFEPIGWPYGGSECLAELLRAFGMTILSISD